MSVTQTGAHFRLAWTLDTPEAVEIRRTVPDELLLGIVEADVTTYVDIRDDVDPGDTVTWVITGVDSSEDLELTATVADLTIPPLDDDRRYLAALMVANRLLKRRDAPLGVAGGGDMGPVMVRYRDPDVDALLLGLRRRNSDLVTQTWPDVDALREFVGAGNAVTDDTLSQVLASAVLIVRRKCEGGFGIA